MILPAIVLVLSGAAAAAHAASPSSQQLRRNAQEIPEVAATATATATITDMIGVDAVDMVMGSECMMMCEVSCTYMYIHVVEKRSCCTTWLDTTTPKTRRRGKILCLLLLLLSSLPLDNLHVHVMTRALHVINAERQ